jgi:peptidoglycan/LPS O-acetylase OafA/YrhL
LSYQKEVDGLRAIAVISVILFHLNVSGFNVGYVGVDVFFVISGYLITRLIKAEVLEAKNFRNWPIADNCKIEVRRRPPAF